MYVTNTMNLQMFAEEVETEEDSRETSMEAELQEQRKAQMHRSFFRHFQGLQRQRE